MSNPLSPAIPPEGPIRSGLPQHLYALAAAHDYSGLLSLKLADCTLGLHFRKGNAESLTSTHPRDALAIFLATQKLATEAQLAQAEAQSMRFGGELLPALFGLGLLNPNAVFPQLVQRARALLLRCLTAEEGTFTFAATELPSQQALPLGHKWAVYLELLRQVPLVEVSRRLSASVDLMVQKGTGLIKMGDLRLTPQETRALQYLDGSRSLRQLAHDLPHDDETLQRCVWMLAPLRLVTFAQSAVGSAQGARQPTAAPGPIQSSPSRVTAPPQVPEKEPAAKPSAAPVDFAAEAKQLQARYTQMQTQNFFDVLGVTREADPGAIKVAYLKAARNYHPDTVPAGAPAILAKVKADIFGLVGEANRTLSDVALRQQYIAQLETGSASSQVDVATILKGEELFHKGRLFVQNRKYQEAAKLFDEAVECNPEEGEFYAWRAYAKFLIAADKKQALPEVMRDLNRCLAKNANVAAAYYFLGFIAKTNGDAAAALANFKKCVAIDPKHIDAQREIRLMAK